METRESYLRQWFRWRRQRPRYHHYVLWNGVFAYFAHGLFQYDMWQWQELKPRRP